MRILFFKKSHPVLFVFIIFALICGFLLCGKIDSASAYVYEGALSTEGIEEAICPNISISDPASWFGCLLLHVLRFVGWVLTLAVTLFTWAVDARKVSAIIDAPQIYLKWKMVRDILNIGFILVLVYTAFTIIFQVDKSNKKIILTIVLMALLVNFSFPISRFIIDLSNTLQYTILDAVIGDPITMLHDTAGKGKLAEIIKPSGGAKTDLSQLLAAIIFVFILAITFMAMALLFLIRTIALAILIIFSPVAFVGLIINKGQEWWGYLFKYCFFGPIMALMIYISVNLMSAFAANSNDLAAIASNTAKDADKSLLVAMSKFTIPIAILWIGMGVAQKAGVFGADKVMGFAQKFITGAGAKIGGKVTGYNWTKKQYADYKKERDARKEEARRKPGKWLGEKANDAQDSVYAALGSKKAQNRIDKRRDDKRRKDMDDKSKEIEDTKTTDEMVVEVNNVFNTTGTIDPTTKVDDTQAGSAKAYTRKNSDEKQEYIKDQLAGKFTTAGSSLENVLGGIVPKAPGTPGANRLELALWKVLNNPDPSSGDLRTVATFVSEQAGKVMKKYVKQ